MNRVLFVYFFIIVLTVQTSLLQAQKPNILWIYAEDTSPWMGCYGNDVNIDATPNIDAIAQAGVRFNRAYVPAPVCSATRSAMIIGQSAIRFGAHQHRSSRTPKTRIQLPQNYKLLPELLSEQGYTTFNFGKADYNFAWNQGKTYNHKLKKRTDFSELVNKQPFFGQIQLRGGKNNTENINKEIKVDPNNVAVPADYPNNKIFKEVVAQHYEAIRVDDNIIGKIIQQLKDTGLYKNTIVVYFSDHGANNLLRHKQMLTEGGLHVPFVVMGPNKFCPSYQFGTSTPAQDNVVAERSSMLTKSLRTLPFGTYLFGPITTNGTCNPPSVSICLCLGRLLATSKILPRYLYSS